MEIYRVLVVGLGKRGLHHASSFQASPRFELVGIATRDQTRLQGALAKLGIVPSSRDIRPFALTARPDVFCFCTPPNARLDLVKLGIERLYGGISLLDLGGSVERRREGFGAGGPDAAVGGGCLTWPLHK